MCFPPHLRLTAASMPAPFPGPLEMQLKGEVATTLSSLDEARAAYAREAAERVRLHDECSALRLDRDRDLRDLRTAHSAELTSAREEGVRRAEEAALARATEVRGGAAPGMTWYSWWRMGWDHHCVGIASDCVSVVALVKRVAAGRSLPSGCMLGSAACVGCKWVRRVVVLA